MVEYAVNRSQEMGQEGRVRTNPLNESTEFFQSLGFRQGDEPEGLYAPPFVLDPRHSAMWRQDPNDGIWSLDKHEHKKYLTANRPVENEAHADDGVG
jgi:hypothetical protein